MAKNRKHETDWLALLTNGDSPLLPRRELEFIAEVRNRIIQQAKTRPGKPVDKDLKDKLSVMKDNFEKIVNYLNKNPQAKDYYIDIYLRWRMVRDLNIRQLMNIAMSVHKESEELKEDMSIGNTISIVGGLLSLATGTIALRVVGGILLGLGALGNYACSDKEINMLKKKVKEAEEVIQEDREFFEKMWDWLNDASYVHKALNIINGINIDKNFINITKEFLDHYKKGSGWGNFLYNLPYNLLYKKKAMDMIVEKTLASLKCSPNTAKEISDVIGILISVFMLKERYSSLFYQVSEAFKCKEIWNSACLAACTAGVNLQASAAIIINPWQRSIFLKGTIITGIALNALNLFVIANEKGSVRKEAKDIIKAAKELENEANIFKELYDVLNDRGPGFRRYPISY